MIPADAAFLPAASKTAGEENFPVASLLLPARTRSRVMAYYHFARHADDVADSPDLTPEGKVAALDALDAVLGGAEGGEAQILAARLRDAVAGDPTLIAHASHLLVAFRRDAVRNHCRDWDDLMEYCRFSAAPVGRFLLDLHGESADGHAASDALCAALQVLNHLQDCAKDLRQLDRVYVPDDMLAAEGLARDVLLAAATSPALRRIFERMLDLTDGLVAEAGPLIDRIRDPRLRLQAAVTVRVAECLAVRLRRGDPLAERVKLGHLDYAGVVVVGIVRAVMAGFAMKRG